MTWLAAKSLSVVTASYQKKGKTPIRIVGLLIVLFYKTLSQNQILQKSLINLKAPWWLRIIELAGRLKILFS